MSVFVYTALRTDGSRVEGELTAQSRAEAHEQLDRERLQPVSLELREAGREPAPVATRAEPAPGGSLDLTRPQIIQFTDELGDLLEAGLQLEPSLRIMERRHERSELKAVVADVRERVVRGVSFSSALKASSPSFGELYCGLVLAGELSGALPQILRRQSRYITSMEDLQSRVIEALIYPAFIAGAGVLLLGIFMTVLVPQLTSLFAKTGQTLPMATRMLVGASDLATRYGWAALLVAAGGGVAFWRAIQRPAQRLWWDRWKLRIPVVGAILAARFYAECAQTLATLVTNGVPLLQGLRLLQGATANLHLRGLLSQVVELVAHGSSLSHAMKHVGGFPPVFADVVAVGEQTGQIGAALEKAAQRYDKELSRQIQRMTSLIQPAVILVMALVVGLVAYAIMAGIFQSVSGLRHRP